MADAAARKLTKIQRKTTEWQFAYVQGTSEYKFKSFETAHGDLTRAMDAVQPFACEATPYLAKDFYEHSIVHAVEFDHKGDDERRNAVVKLMVKAGSDGMKPVESNKKLADVNMEEAKKARWSKEAVESFDELEKQAFAFIDGARAIQPLPLVDNETEMQDEGFIDDSEFEDHA